MHKAKISQVKYGAILSYTLIILNSLYAIVMTPFIINALGQDEYGVYKTIASLATSMMVMDIGLGGTVQRYVAKYKADGQDHKIPNFIAMSLIIAFVLNIAVIIISIAMCFLIEPLYGTSFSATQVQLAKKLFLLLALNLLMVIVENVLNGLIAGCNKFVFSNGLKLALLILKIGLIILLLSPFGSAVMLVLISLCLSVVTGVMEIIYITKYLKIKIKLQHWDMSVFREAGKYTSLMFLTSVATQFFSNLDNIVIGAIKGAALVTVYSVGLTFFSMFQSLSQGIAGVMLPTVTNTLSQENGEQKIVNVIIKAGKAQFILLGAALVGFLCIGQDFVSVWMGQGYEDVYIISLILLIPSIFELCINVCHSILRAQNKLGFRTVVVISSAVLNAVLTVLFVSNGSYVGAAVATASSDIICNLIIMNIYYQKALKLPMLKIYGSIMGRVVVCLAISGVCLFAFSRYVNGSWLAIALNILLFCVIYGITLLLIGLNHQDKKQIPLVKKFIK